MKIHCFTDFLKERINISIRTKEFYKDFYLFFLKTVSYKIIVRDIERIYDLKSVIRVLY